MKKVLCFNYLPIYFLTLTGITGIDIKLKMKTKHFRQIACNICGDTESFIIAVDFPFIPVIPVMPVLVLASWRGPP
jgi:hypothetical protein